MEIAIAEQTMVFFYALLLGVAMGAVYEVIRILRVAGFNRKHHLIISDILFMTFAAFVTFLFALAYSRGHVRFYILLGEIAGCLAFRYTVGALASRVYSSMIRKIRKITALICKKIKKFVNLLLKSVTKPLYNIYKNKNKKVNEKKQTTKKNKKFVKTKKRKK